MPWTPPPEWPAPPSPGWSPPAGWQPDPAWGPPPPDWNFWPPAADGAAPAGAGGWANEQVMRSPYDALPQLPVLGRVRAGSAVVIAGAIAAIVGSLGTWIHLTSFGRNFDQSGFNNGHDGPVVVAFAVVVGVLAGWRILSANAPRWLCWIVLALAVIIVLICLADASDVHNKVHDAHVEVPALTGGVGWGLWVGLLGGAISTTGAAIAIDVRRSR